LEEQDDAPFKTTEEALRYILDTKLTVKKRKRHNVGGESEAGSAKSSNKRHE
jgi:hypothetical protein